MAENKEKESEKSKREVTLNMSLNMLFGIVLAVFGTFIMFFGNDISYVALIVIGIVAVCLGAVGAVDYIKNRGAVKNLVISLLEVVAGLALILFSSFFGVVIFTVAAVILAAYGVYLLVKSKGKALKVILGLVFIVVGVMLFLYAIGAYQQWGWINTWFKYVLGTAAYCGAIFFLFFDIFSSNK